MVTLQLLCQVVGQPIPPSNPQCHRPDQRPNQRVSRRVNQHHNQPVSLHDNQHHNHRDNLHASPRLIQLGTPPRSHHRSQQVHPVTLLATFVALESISLTLYALIRSLLHARHANLDIRALVDARIQFLARLVNISLHMEVLDVCPVLPATTTCLPDNRTVRPVHQASTVHQQQYPQRPAPKVTTALVERQTAPLVQVERTVVRRAFLRAQHVLPGPDALRRQQVSFYSCILPLSLFQAY